MEETIRNSILSAFCADALALGVHWVYDTQAIAAKYGRLTDMIAPELADYHGPREKGEFTHYGDQAMILLASVSKDHIFELKGFSRRWQAVMAGYNGYVDHATKESLAHFKRGSSPEISGAVSLDLGGASRMFPLGLLLARGVEKADFVRACMDQTRMTHNTPQAISSARFLAKVYTRVVSGMAPVAAMEDTLDKNPDLPMDVMGLVRAALGSRDEETPGVIKRFGQACAWDGALAGAVHLMARYETDLETALVENTMAGGDSAARGMPVGWILGAHSPRDLPQRWRRDLKALDRIQDLMGN